MSTANPTSPPTIDCPDSSWRGAQRLAVACLGAGLSLAGLLAWLKFAWSSVPLQQFIHGSEPYAGVALIAAGVFFGVIGALWSRRTGAQRSADAVLPPSPWRSLVSPLSFALTLMLFTCPLFASLTGKARPIWETGSELFLVPFSDASGYYGGAQIVMSSGTLDSWNVRRPLNALTLAARLALVGNDFESALLLQGLLLGVVVWLFAAIITRDLGTPAGVAAIGILYAIGREWSALTLSEALGMTWGTLAAGLLWSGIRSRRLWVLAAGAFALMMAQNCRTGALLALPLLIPWAGLAFRSSGRFNWRPALIMTGALALGFAVQIACIRMYAGKVTVGQGNFSFTLYNLACGVPGWTKVYDDYPQTKKMPEEELNAFIYARAFERIRENPSGLAAGYVRGFVPTLTEIVAFGGRSLRFPSTRAFALVLLVLLGLCVRWAWNHWRRPEFSFLLTQGAGILISGPIVVPTSGIRTLVASYATLALVALVSVARAGKRPAVSATVVGEQPTALMGWGMAVAAVLTLAPLIGPGLISQSGIYAPPAMADLGDRDWTIIRTGPGLPQIRLPSRDGNSSAPLPLVQRCDFAARLPELRIEGKPFAALDDLEGPAVVFLTADLRPGQTALLRWIVAPESLVGREWKWWRVRLGRRDTTHVLVTQAEPLGEVSHTARADETDMQTPTVPGTRPRSALR
jgi:hypothetical protein